MRRRGFSVIPLVLAGAALVFLSLPIQAAEPHLRFLQGLKDRGYFNTALEYLDSLESDASTPKEVLAIVPYERAQILVESNALLVSLDEQRRQLNLAEANLDRFVKQSPDHPLAGQANSERAHLLRSRAQVDIWDADAMAVPARQKEMQTRARGYLTQARTIISKAVSQNEAAVKSFPTLIPESEKARRAERDEVLTRLIQSQLESAEITYWEARTWPPGSPERKKGLESAASQFEELSQKYSQGVGGMFARIWQGKCFEELGEVGKALGIYDQVLKTDDPQPAVQTMKDAARHFRLVCLNHEQRKDYGVVIDEAEEWLRENGSRATTAEGLGIQWEMCRALEALGNDRNRSESQRRGDLNQALDRARVVSRHGGEQRAEATRMVQRLTVALDRKGAAPRDFETAYAAGSAVIEDAGKTGDAYRSAVASGDEKQAGELMRAIKASGVEAERLFTQALALRSPKTEPEKAATARLQLAYAYFLQGRYLDCAVIADHQMRTWLPESKDVAREAGFLAMSALDAASLSQPRGSSVESQMMQSIGEFMIATWPESDRSQEARMLLGRSAFTRGENLEAAKWWTAVPAAASQFATAQISAGQAWWKEYVRTSQLPEAERPSAEELGKWKSSAVQTLERGIRQREVSVGRSADTPDDLVLGKLVLAQIRNLDGRYRGEAGQQGAIELLTKAPHAVIDAVDVADGEARPTDGALAKSAKIASFAYQQLLRAYVGVRDLDAAREARLKLESVAGSENPQALTAIYVEFGRELQRELGQLRAIGESDRATKTRQAFEDFLGDLAARSDGQSLTSLLWIAETYAGLADDAKASQESAQTYTQKSAETYNRILSRADEPGFLPSPNYKTAIRLNLAVNQRRQGDFVAAEETIKGLLTDSPSAPDVQAEAATLYEDWGRSEGAQGQAKLLTAISGRRSAPEVWGWNRIVQRLQREPASRRTPALNQLLIDARAHLASSEIAMAEIVAGEDDKAQHLNVARHAIFSFIRSTPDYSDADYARFNALYATVQKDLRQPVMPLAKTATALVITPTERVAKQDTPRKVRPGDTAATTTTSTGSGVSMMVPVLIGLGLAAAGGMLYYWYRQNSEKRRRRLERRRAATTSS